MASTLPRSETHFGVNSLAVLCGLTTAYVTSLFASELTLLARTACVIAGTVLPILLTDLLWRMPGREPSAGLTASRPVNAKRVAIKSIGMVATLGIFALLYWLFPIYREPFYLPYWELLRWLLPAMLIATPFYFAWCDARLTSPEDGYYHLGCAVLMRRNLHIRPIGIHLRNWLVKAFFLPLMLVYLMQNINMFAQLPHVDASKPMQLYSGVNNLLYLIDLLFACTGYIMTLRIVNAHIRSSEPTMLGWVAAVACYTPFWSTLFYTQYFAYDNDGDFQRLLTDAPGLQWMIGVTVLILIAIYSSATIALGYRFSNLTYRGLVTNGPYRFCKHPAYVAKNISWWLISLPFIALDADTAIRNCLLLLGVNTLYFIRARTEERHLSNYPEYVAYAEAMNTHSIFAPLTRLIPALKYTKPTTPPRID